MFAYYLKAAMLQDKGELVVIDGLCASACTVYLELACATPRAKIGFHSPKYSNQIREKMRQDQDGINIRQLEQREARRLLSTYPRAVRSWLRKRGGLTTKVLWLTGMDAVELLGEC